MYNPYWNLTDEELLAEVRVAGLYSPLIAELADRLENDPRDCPEIEAEVVCPVCRADLLVDSLAPEGILTIKGGVRV